MPRQKITKRKDGRYSAMVSVGRDPDTGRLKRKTVYGKTKTEVRAKIKELEAQVAKGEVTASTKENMTVAEWADIWLKEFASNTRQNTYHSYKEVVKCHIKPVIGNVKLGRLSLIECQRFVNSLKDKGFKPGTINTYSTALKTMLNKAVEVGYITKNPMDGVKKPRKSKREIHPFTEGQVSLFLKAAKGSEYFNLYRVLLFSGMRVSEAIALDWGSVGEDSLTVSKQFPYLKSDTNFQPTKNGKSRKVPMNAQLKKALEDERAAQEAAKKAAGEAFSNSLNLVFTDSLGDRMCVRTVEKRFKISAKAIGCPHARVHDLRHTYAVLSLKAGIDPKTLSESLGHSSSAFTLDMYAYVTDDMRRESGEKLGNLLDSLGLGASE